MTVHSIFLALASTPDGRGILRGTVTLDYRTTERMMVLNLPGHGQGTFRLRLPASPFAFRPVRTVAPRGRHRPCQWRHGDVRDS
jgi:hypothetical protein